VEHLYSIFGNFKQLYSFWGTSNNFSILGNFKQLHSNLNDMQPLHLYLHTLRNIWANSNSLDHIWVIETA